MIETNDEEYTDQVDELEIPKPSASEVREAIETLINFSMFTESSEIGALIMKTSGIAEIELAATRKQKNITDFFVVKTHFIQKP